MPDAIPGKLVAPEPAPPVRQYSFTDWQVNNPTAPPPGDRLDAEFDRGNSTQSQTLDWAGTSLNTDGTLRPGIVGEPQFVPGLFDHIADDAVAQVQPLVDKAGSYATQALSSANSALSYSSLASGSSTSAGQAATDARTAATSAEGAAVDAQNSADAAAVSASGASDSANHADGSEAQSQAYADVSMAWAEHMPDTIPPNILAVMGVTGDHWSSRWWANQADESVSDGLDQIIIEGDRILAEMQKLWLGAHPQPPTQDSQGNPLTTGAVYYDTTTETLFVWTGTAWKPIAEPSPLTSNRYIYVATQGQTVFTGPDRSGLPLKYSPVASQQLAVYRNGLLRTPDDDYATNVDQIAFLTPTDAGDVVQILVQMIPVVNYTWTTAALDTSGWVFDGVRKDFPLLDRATGEALIMSGAGDLILSRDGVWQRAEQDYVLSGPNVRFIQAPAPGATLFGVAIVVNPPKVAQIPGVTALDTSDWVCDGVATLFPLKDLVGSLVTPPNAETVLISLNGVWQQAYRDYTVSGSTVTFTRAPDANAAAFGVAGLPAFLAEAGQRAPS